MSIVRFSRAAFAFAGSMDVFSELELSFDQGFTGLVGENGGGKTTLLRLILGEIALSKGRLEVQAAPDQRLLCRQRVDRCSSELGDFLGRFDSEALRWQARLQVQHSECFENLSPGERKRWQIAWALCQEPRVLLLDEPTNHLDREGRELLVSALRSYKGVGIVASHDRELLDALCTRTVRLEKGMANAVALPYSQARRHWQKERERDELVLAKARSDLRKGEKHRARLRDQRARAEQKISAKSRIKGPRDSDARSVNARARAESGEATLSRRLSAEASRLHRKRRHVEDLSVDKKLGSAIAFKGNRNVRRRLAVFEGDLRAGSCLLARDLFLVVGRESRIHLRGANGTGKTTLLRALVENTSLEDHEYFYLPQLVDAREEGEVRAELRAAPPDELGQIMTVAAALGIDPARVLASQAYSPGQLRKLLIARALARNVSLLVLDEPTNHLDLPSVERLEDALLDFPGALLLVSHDEHFARRLAPQVWWLDAEALTIRATG